LTVGEKRVIRGGSWIAPEGTIRSTHRFWNHPLNNSYGVGLGFQVRQDRLRPTGSSASETATSLR
jgi:formylglycine-generating enzyme required for sulfatase activity